MKVFSEVRLVVFASLAFQLLAETVAARAQDAKEQDNTMHQLRSLDSHFPFVPPADAKQWNVRRNVLKQHLAISLGLWPEPERTPLNAVEHSRREIDDYSVSCVYFESLPGFFVTGNLYRPRSGLGKVSKAPVVLCPYGHFNNGRFLDHDQKAIDEMIARNEESDPSNARSPLQAHCVHLARMGCVVFHYDMVGYADSKQISQEVAHHLRDRRENDNQREGWLFFSPLAEMHNQSVMGLQTWNSIRAVDFVQSLKGVDPLRIGVTGCSGGGTQTFILAALDDRVQAAFAAAMVSTRMQGGCTCENACNVRTVTGNVELAALFAPKPMGFSAADDWTKEMPRDGFPQLQELYQILGHPDKTFLAPSLNLPHGYNEIARRSMYCWFNQHLKIVDDPDGLTTAQVYKGEFPPTSIYRERPFQVLTLKEMSVWNDDHPVPPAGIEIEMSITRSWAKSQAASIQQFRQNDSAKLKTIARSLICDFSNTDQDQLRSESVDSRISEFEDQNNRPTLLRVFNDTDFRKGVFLHQWRTQKSASPMICVMGDFSNAGSWARAILNEACKRELSIVAIDSKQLLQLNQQVGERAAAGYTFGYNRTSLAKDARAISWVIDHLCREQTPSELWIVALDGTTPIAAVAAAASHSKTPCTKFFGAKASFHSVCDFRDPNFLPGALILGDVKGMIQIADPTKLVMRDHDASISLEALIEDLF
jgi:hypothetical protein